MNKIISASKEKIVKVLKKFWRNLIMVLVFLLVLDLIAAGLLLARYYFWLEKPWQTFPSLGVNPALLEIFTSQYQKRQALFEQIGNEQYPDMFQGLEQRPEQAEEKID